MLLEILGTTVNHSLKKELLSKILKKRPLNKQVGREEAFRQKNSMCKVPVARVQINEGQCYWSTDWVGGC